METTTYTHELYESGDDDCPGEILDANGEVCLGQCRICGKAESDLDGPCVPKQKPQLTFKQVEPDVTHAVLHAGRVASVLMYNDVTKRWYIHSTPIGLSPAVFEELDAKVARLKNCGKNIMPKQDEGEEPKPVKPIGYKVDMTAPVGSQVQAYYSEEKFSLVEDSFPHVARFRSEEDARTWLESYNLCNATQEPCQQARGTTGTDSSQRVTNDKELKKAASVGPAPPTGYVAVRLTTPEEVEAAVIPVGSKILSNVGEWVGSRRVGRYPRINEVFAIPLDTSIGSYVQKDKNNTEPSPLASADSQRVTNDKELKKAAEVGPGGGLSDHFDADCSGDFEARWSSTDLNGPKLVNYEEAYHKAADQVLEQARKIEQLELTPKVVPCKCCSCELLTEKDARIKELEEEVQLKEEIADDYYQSAQKIRATVADLDKERNELKAELSSEKQIKGCAQDMLAALQAATKGHSLGNVTKFMEAMPPAEDLEGYELTYGIPKKGDCTLAANGQWFTNCGSSQPILIRTPIVEYIPTEEITDELVEKYGRIPVTSYVYGGKDREGGMLVGAYRDTTDVMVAVILALDLGRSEHVSVNTIKIKKSDLPQEVE